MKRKIAFIKFAGLSSSGVEKYLQTIALLLDKNIYEIDYFYTNPAPSTLSGFVHPDNCPIRKSLLEDAGINLIPVHVDHRIGHPEPYEWVGTDFWNLFNENNYDVLTTGRCGYPEYPFTNINKVKIIDTIHSFTGTGDKHNTVKAILLCKWAADKWAASGGDIRKVEIIPSIVYVPDNLPTGNLRSKLDIPEDAFVYGFHQGSRAGMFHPMALNAFNRINNKKNYFLIMGGDPQYQQYAKSLGLNNVIFVNASSDINNIHRFLNTIDVFAHSRADGEVCSACIIEALAHSKPVLSHPALNMGHVEQIGDCGIVTDSLDLYTEEMKRLESSRDYYQEKSAKAKIQYETKYDYKKIEQQIKDLFSHVI